MDEIKVDKLFDVSGLSVVVTGGATGIGLMMTKAFVANGAAKVFIVGRRKETLRKAAQLSPKIVPLVGDITSKESLINVAKEVKDDIGYVNFLCCNSGKLPDGISSDTSTASVEDYARAALDTDMDDWNSTFAANLTGAAFTTFAFLPLLAAGNHHGGSSAAAAGRSQVLITGSVAGYLRGPGANIPYSVSKNGVHHLVKLLADNFVPYDIRVNGFAPGLFPSEISEGLIAMLGQPEGGDGGVEGAYPRKLIPAQRVGGAEDVAGLVLFLASKAGAYLNGSVVLNDGGRLNVLPGTY